MRLRRPWGRRQRCSGVRRRWPERSWRRPGGAGVPRPVAAQRDVCAHPRDSRRGFLLRSGRAHHVYLEARSDGMSSLYRNSFSTSGPPTPAESPGFFTLRQDLWVAGSAGLGWRGRRSGVAACLAGVLSCSRPRPELPASIDSRLEAVLADTRLFQVGGPTSAGAASVMTSESCPVQDRVPDVAVIVAAFNAGFFFNDTLTTVAGQTQAPVAVVLGDDCSTDDTVERALRWKSRLPIEVVRLEQNAGPAAARHQAILATDAPLLAILDADDLLLPDHLETMRAAYERGPGLVTAQELAWIPGRGIDLVPRRARPKPVPTDHAEQLLQLLQRNYMNFPLFSRELYELVGGFRQQFLVGEDWDLWIRM